ncbi:MAG: energy-coupling factor transporter ATPase [Anaerolineae bacterium]
METPLIEVQGVHYTYLRGTPWEAAALRGVDLEVWPGETVALIGPTGSGKSTLLQHLNGLLRPQAGKVRAFGLDLSDPRTDVRSIRKRVGLVMQQPEAQLFERYAGDDVAFGPLNFGLSLDEARERVRNAMEAVGLSFQTYKNRLTLTLSSGERRRLALAGVLALEPQVLVLDEPTSGLDPRGRAELLALLRRWNEEEGRAMVMASHNMDEVALLADRVAVLVDGQVKRVGPPREIFSDPEFLLKHGLSLPLASQVARVLAGRGCPIAGGLLTLEEARDAIVRLIHEPV